MLITSWPKGQKAPLTWISEPEWIPKPWGFSLIGNSHGLPPKMADDRAVRRLIMRAFNLPDGAEFIGDEHYQDPADIDWED